MAGGRATHAGIAFQDQVGGLLSVHVLADAPDLLIARPRPLIRSNKCWVGRAKHGVVLRRAELRAPGSLEACSQRNEARMEAARPFCWRSCRA